MIGYKKILFLLLLTTQLFSASMYTMDNIKDLNLYIDNQTNFLDKKELEKSLKNKLEMEGFVFGKVDALILVIKVQALDIEDSVAIYISIGLGEEVITKRKDKIETFSYTYLESKFIEAYEPKEDALEALDSLIDDFILAHKDDN
ncbi:hypothetical protein JHD50_10335 [Sulfurimonas sp. MAG313]|nr:hypothetical protein [Sulfurimonas sp. MAG313]MDF1881690.1 hypothetical protein [Sulfurimonas sp. MAG313]